MILHEKTAKKWVENLLQHAFYIDLLIYSYAYDEYVI